MIPFDFKSLLRLTKAEIAELEKSAKEGDSRSQCKLAFCHMYGICGDVDFSTVQNLLKRASDSGDYIATLMLGFFYEHGLNLQAEGAESKSYTLAIRYYSKGFELMNGIVVDRQASTTKGLSGNQLQTTVASLKKSLSSVLSIKDFCRYSEEGHFVFDWTDEVLERIVGALVPVSKAVRDFESQAKKALAEPWALGSLEFEIQDQLLMPLEVCEAAAGRTVFRSLLVKQHFRKLSKDSYLDWAMGRCLIDDDDKEDNDYIISGLLIIAGHDSDPVWIYRTGLWYEYDQESRDLKEAHSWYSRASADFKPASEALKRIESSKEYGLLKDISFGTADDCSNIAQSYHQNRELANAWNIMAALRGDSGATRRLEQITALTEDPKEESSPYYKIIDEEADNVSNSYIRSWLHAVPILAEEGRKKLAEERAKIEKLESEAKKKAEAERLKKEQEAAAALTKQQEIEAEKMRVQELMPVLKAEAEAFEKLKTSLVDNTEPCKRLFNQIESRIKEINAKGSTGKRFVYKALDRGFEKKLNDRFQEANTLLKNYSDGISVIMKFVKSSDSLIKNTDSSKSSKDIDAAINKIRKNTKDIGVFLDRLVDPTKALEETWTEVRSMEPEYHLKVNTAKILRWVIILLSLFFVGRCAFRRCGSDNASNEQEMEVGGSSYEEYGTDEAEKNYEEMIKEETEKIEKQIEEETENLQTQLSEQYGSQREEADALLAKATTEQSEHDWRSDYDFVYGKDSSLGWYKVKKDGKLGFVDSNGKVVVSPKYDDISRPNSENGLMKVQLNGKYGFINSAGKEVVNPKYDYISSYPRDGFIEVQLNDKYGAINNAGREVIPPKYDYISGPDSETGVVKVQSGDKYGMIDKNGKVVLAVQYESISDFNNGLYKLTKGKKYGVANRVGKIIVPVTYDDVSILSRMGWGWIEVRTGNVFSGKLGLYDHDGRVIMKAECDQVIAEPNKGTVLVTKNGMVGHIGKDGKLVAPMKKI